MRLCNVARVEIDPPSSVAYATNCLQFSSPEGKSFCKASFALHNKATGRKYEVVVTIYLSAIYSLVKVVFAMYARRKEGFPSGGSWRRRRLMRGDQSPLTIGILLAEWLCASDVRRFRIRHHNESHPTYQSGAKPRHVKNLHLPSKLRTSPESTRSKQNESNLCHAKAGALGGSSR